MPGVPSGRGCDACRQQKKKCEAGDPACLRYTRLQIPCIGSGQRRFIFKDQKCTRRQLKQPAKPESVGMQIMLPLSSGTNKLRSAFLETSRPTVDCRFNLASTYGSFILDLPCRFGTNEALDAAAQALVTVHTDFALNLPVSVKGYSQYSDALGRLKDCLDIPAIAGSIDTLCAVILLLICHNLSAFGLQHYSSHCRGAKEIVKARGHFNMKDEFEVKILQYLRGSVLLGGVVDREARLNPHAFDGLEQKFAACTTEEDVLSWLYKLPNIFERGRAVRHGSLDGGALIDEIEEIYTMMKNVKMELSVSFSDDPVSLRSQLLSYGAVLALCCVLNCMQKALDPRNRLLREEGERFVAETLAVGERSERFRPLGASHMLFGLYAAWICTEEISTRSVVLERMEDFRHDFDRGKEWRPITPWLEMLAADFRFDTPSTIASRRVSLDLLGSETG